MIGLGSIGIQVIEELHARGTHAVVVERQDGNRYLNRARALGVPVVVADSTQRQTLEAANVHSAAAVAVLAVLAEGTGFLEGMGHVRRPLKRGVSGWKGKAFEKRNSAEKEQREMRDLGVLFASVPCQCGVAPIVPFATCSGNFESIAYRVVRFMYVTVYIASKMRDVSFDKSLRCQPKI